MAEAYIEYCFNVNPKVPWEDILLAELQMLPFESFINTKDGLNGYVPLSNHKKNFLESIGLLNKKEVIIKVSRSEIFPENWNAQWESKFDPIFIGDECVIRADFHENQDKKFELIINPKMSFGTGHHPTTHMMVEFILETSLIHKTILDMGCGTGILGILALKKGALRVKAIDNDPMCIKNSIENAKRNNCKNFHAYEAASLNLEYHLYDIIFANINTNILLDQISSYAQVLKKGGSLFLSGFYENDARILYNICQKENLNLISSKESEAWCAMKFLK
tara:strand:+ start:333 stop:1166 length:834 start_codon:yes stop_codon:yes gene_type:complete